MPSDHFSPAEALVPPETRQQISPLFGAIQNISWGGLLALAVLFLAFDRAPTAAYLLGFSGTFWTVAVTATFAGTGTTALVFGARNSGRIARLSSETLIFLSLAASLIAVLSLSLFWFGTWNGYQVIVSLITFVLVFAFAATNGAKSLSVSSEHIVLGLLLIASIAIMVAHLSGAEFSFSQRARGQTFALAAAVTPLLTRSRLVGASAFIVFAGGAVLSDSRFASATIAIVAGFLVMALWREKRVWLRASAAILASAISATLIAFFQALGGLRMSFNMPFLGFLPSSVVEPASVEPASVEPASVEPASVGPFWTEEKFVELNRWSMGRAMAWRLLLGQMQSTTDWVLGKGSGFASTATQDELRINHPHNEYLRFLVDGGVIGLLLFIALGVTVFIGLIRARPRIGQRRFWAGIALLFLLASHSLVTNTLIFPHFFIPAALFLGVAMASQVDSERQLRQEAHQL